MLNAPLVTHLNSSQNSAFLGNLTKFTKETNGMINTRKQKSLKGYYSILISNTPSLMRLSPEALLIKNYSINFPDTELNVWLFD